MSTVKVKVKVSTLISHLEKALAEREVRFKNQEKEQAKYEKAVEEYNLAILKIIKAGKAEFTDCTRYNTYGNAKKSKAEFSVTVTIPKSLVPAEPERPEDYQDYLYKREREEITQAIRVLKLTEEQFVSASTYASVAKYL